MKSKVAFIPWEKGWEQKIPFLFSFLGLKGVQGNSILGVKTHFGEEGNITYLPAEITASIVKYLKKIGANPLLIETTTLYSGERQDAVSHMRLAYRHGFSPEKVGAPIAIVDGLRGTNHVKIPLKLKYVKEAKIGSYVPEVEGFVGITHFKGHMVTGFGGTLKNFAMGLSAKAGKLEMHSESKPYIIEEKCKQCEICLSYCPYEAIKKIAGSIKIEAKICAGCGGCITVCQEEAIEIDWNQASEIAQKKMVEYFHAVVKDKPAFYLNFLINITPHCDCFGIKLPLIKNNIGIALSKDPVALDQASYDFVKEEIRRAHPSIDPSHQLEYAEKIGLGQRNYELVEL